MNKPMQGIRSKNSVAPYVRPKGVICESGPLRTIETPIRQVFISLAAHHSIAYLSTVMKKREVPQSARRKHEPVDDRLLATAGRCFLEEGFGFGIDDILAQSGVAKMSLYTKFGSKYGLIERLLEDAAREWRAEIDLVAADDSLPGPEKILRLLKVICTASRDSETRTGLLGQAIIEFPLTGKEDETHKKRNLVHVKARELQRDLLISLERVCGDAGVADPLLFAQQVMLLVNGYLIMEPLLGKTQAVQLTIHTSLALMGITPPTETPVQKPSPLGVRRAYAVKNLAKDDGPKVISPPRKNRSVFLPNKGVEGAQTHAASASHPSARASKQI